MRNIKLIIMTTILVVTVISCNDGVMGNNEVSGKRKEDRSLRTMIDSNVYVDFTIKEYNAMTWKREKVLDDIGGKMYKNRNSYIKINKLEGTIEISTDSGYFNNKEKCQIYGKFGFDVVGASTDCLYIRRKQDVGGIIMIDSITYKDNEIPDLVTCIPLYGYSSKRIEVSPIMNGFIAMPSGTYWNK